MYFFDFLAAWKLHCLPPEPLMAMQVSRAVEKEREKAAQRGREKAGKKAWKAGKNAADPTRCDLNTTHLC